MKVAFQKHSAPVTVPASSGNGANVNPGFKATGGEKVAEVVVRQVAEIGGAGGFRKSGADAGTGQNKVVAANFSQVVQDRR